MARFGINNWAEIDDSLDHSGCAQIKASCRRGEWLEKQDAVEIIAHLKKVFELDDGEIENVAV